MSGLSNSGQSSDKLFGAPAQGHEGKPSFVHLRSSLGDTLLADNSSIYTGPLHSMHNFSTFLLVITVLLSEPLGSVPFVSGAVIKAREGNPGVGHSLMDLEGNPLRPDFNETRTFKILQLPVGFNFSDPDRNVTRHTQDGIRPPPRTLRVPAEEFCTPCPLPIAVPLPPAT
jgi:hypothetical protein